MRLRLCSVNSDGRHSGAPYGLLQLVRTNVENSQTSYGFGQVQTCHYSVDIMPLPLRASISTALPVLQHNPGNGCLWSYKTPIVHSVGDTVYDTCSENNLNPRSSHPTQRCLNHHKQTSTCKGMPKILTPKQSKHLGKRLRLSGEIQAHKRCLLLRPYKLHEHWTVLITWAGNLMVLRSWWWLRISYDLAECSMYIWSLQGAL